MSLSGEKQVRNILIVKDYPDHATMDEARNAVNGDGLVLSADGTAPANGEEFMVGVKNYKGDITQYKLDPSKVTFGVATKAVAAVPKVATVPIASSTAGELYAVGIEVPGVGSLSVEDFLLIEGFYKAKTGDNTEDVVDGLVKSLARNFSRHEPTTRETFLLTDKAGTEHTLPANRWFDFDKNTSDGTAEISTLQVTAAATEAGNIKLTLNGTDYFVPITVQTINQTAADIEAWFDAGNAPDYTASSATDTVTITSKYERVEQDLAVDANGVATFAATAATPTPGVDGTTFELVITEKDTWLADYYVTGKKVRTNLRYTVLPNFPTDVTVAYTGGTPAKGSGYQVRTLEEHLLGNRQDTFRGAGYPHNFEQVFDSEVGSTYHVIDLEYYDEGRDDAQVKSKKQLTICVAEAVGTFTNANALIADLNTAINGANGVTIATLS